RAEIECVAVTLGPLHERPFPLRKLRRLRAVERHTAALHLVPAVVRVQAVAAPVRVRVVSVGRELDEYLRVLARLLRPQHEERGATAEFDEVVTGFPTLGADGEADRPAAPVRGGVLRDVVSERVRDRAG